MVGVGLCAMCESKESDKMDIYKLAKNDRCISLWVNMCRRARLVGLGCNLKRPECLLWVDHSCSVLLSSSLVLYAVDKGLRGRNVLQSLLLILLRICSRSVRLLWKL